MGRAFRGGRSGDRCSYAIGFVRRGIWMENYTGWAADSDHNPLGIGGMPCSSVQGSRCYAVVHRCYRRCQWTYWRTYCFYAYNISDASVTNGHTILWSRERSMPRRLGGSLCLRPICVIVCLCVHGMLQIWALFVRYRLHYRKKIRKILTPFVV